MNKQIIIKKEILKVYELKVSHLSCLSHGGIHHWDYGSKRRLIAEHCKYLNPEMIQVEYKHLSLSLSLSPS